MNNNGNNENPNNNLIDNSSNDHIDDSEPIEFDIELFNHITENVQIIDKKMNIYDIVNMFLENNQSEDPFMIINVGDVIRQYNKWMKFLPNVKPYYAVKCNPDPVILNLLAKLGVNFDCASKNEIAKIIDMKVESNRIIYANPCKMVSQIRFARSHDVDLLTFDSEYELYKLKIYHPDAKLVLRIKTDDSNSVCKFNCKFGCDLEEVESILKVGKEIKLNIIGVSFHVGSGCMSNTSYEHAIRDSAIVFKIAESIGFNFELLDIGGGFLGIDNDQITFQQVAETINNSIDKYFGGFNNINVIAEPGRFFTSKSHTLVLSIINKKIKINKETNEKTIIYYISDGVYSSFNNIYMDHFVVNENNLIPFNERDAKLYKCTIFGPTCDSIDKITDNILLPDLSIGETIICKNMGSYTTSMTIASSEVFNGFDRTKCKYILN